MHTTTRHRPLPWLVLGAMVVAFVVLAARPTHEPATLIDADSSPPAAVTTTTAPPIVVVPATVAPAVVVDVPAIEAPAPAPVAPTVHTAPVVAPEAIPDDAMYAAPVVEDPAPASCPRDGTTYTAGSCQLDPSTMPAAAGSDVRYCSALNWEAPADYPCDYDPSTWTCDTPGDYHGCRPNDG